jgi:hypothetical protein
MAVDSGPQLKRIGVYKKSCEGPALLGNFCFLESYVLITVRKLRADYRSKDQLVLPRFKDWQRGDQAKILKMFLAGNGFPKIKFHSLRACFATQLLAKGKPAAIVMKICGWRDLKTMEFYIRVAGVDEKGATDCLSILPEISAVGMKGNAEPLLWLAK